ADVPGPGRARLGVFYRQSGGLDRAVRARNRAQMSVAATLADGQPNREMVPGYLAVSRISKRFGGATVLSELDIAVGKGEFVSLLGPSGCGKTTLLRIIAGLLAPDTGLISVAGRDLTRVAAHRRNIGVVFQNYALFPHLTVAENVAFGLHARRTPRAEVADRV